MNETSVTGNEGSSEELKNAAPEDGILGEVDEQPGELTNDRYYTLIQPTLLLWRGDQVSTMAIVSTNPFTKL